jgi:hypothetical protein
MGLGTNVRLVEGESMRKFLLTLIQAYAWIAQIGYRRRERARIKAKMERLKREDPFNYPTY